MGYLSMTTPLEKMTLPPQQPLAVCPRWYPRISLTNSLHKTCTRVNLSLLYYTWRRDPEFPPLTKKPWSGRWRKPVLSTHKILHCLEGLMSVNSRLTPWPDWCGGQISLPALRDFLSLRKRDSWTLVLIVTLPQMLYGVGKFKLTLQFLFTLLIYSIDLIYP